VSVPGQTVVRGQETSPLVAVYYELVRLKQLYRRGWLLRGPEKRCESVAEHSFGVCSTS
ncbi:MAG: HD domain-containing protein, partial [bacterium]|nr:HD domain-containing protein [bacterium]